MDQKLARQISEVLSSTLRQAPLPVHFFNSATNVKKRKPNVQSRSSLHIFDTNNGSSKNEKNANNTDECVAQSSRRTILRKTT